MRVFILTCLAPAVLGLVPAPAPAQQQPPGIVIEGGGAVVGFPTGGGVAGDVPDERGRFYIYKSGFWTPVYIRVGGGTTGVTQGKIIVEATDRDDVQNNYTVPLPAAGLQPHEQYLAIAYTKTGSGGDEITVKVIGDNKERKDTHRSQSLDLDERSVRVFAFLVGANDFDGDFIAAASGLGIGDRQILLVRLQSGGRERNSIIILYIVAVGGFDNDFSLGDAGGAAADANIDRGPETGLINIEPAPFIGDIAGNTAAGGKTDDSAATFNDDAGRLLLCRRGRRHKPEHGRSKTGQDEYAHMKSNVERLQ